MRWNPLHISLDTIVACSPLLGHELESRRPIAAAQDEDIADRIAAASDTPLRGQSQRDLFCIAPLDLLVSEQNGRKQFHLLELNGTGIGGLSNLPDRNVCQVLQSLAESCAELDDPDGVVLLAISGKENETSPRMNRLMHEKLLFVEAMRAGLASRHGHAEIMNLEQLRHAGTDRARGGPIVTLGYMKDLLRDLELDDTGGLWLHGRPVMGAVNDRFCRNMLQRFDERVDMDRLQTLNRCFAAGADKGIAYSLFNDYVRNQRQPWLPETIRHAHAHCRLELAETVLDWLAMGRKVVIKPHGTGLGHGIEFFFDRHESLDRIMGRIDRSLALTEEYYGVSGGALPYTVCEFVDACRIRSAEHTLCGHKYELRVVVYRHGMMLRAFPSIAKIARERDEGGGQVRRALINNITASGDTSKVHGVDFMLPLCNQRTLELLDLTLEEVETLCGSATGYVRHVLDQLEDDPERLGLPEPEAARPRLLAAA